MPPLVALVDCSNFYVSCERLFRPDLAARPVAVLSNNDGCVVARSDEVKALGVPMGAPYFKVRRQLQRAGCTVFSSNYALYADVSRRVAAVLEGYGREVERYSIDEAFLTLRIGDADAGPLADALRADVWRHTGIPVRVGLARTKTLAKVASEVAKRMHAPGHGPCVALLDAGTCAATLAALPVGDVWGIGRRWAARLEADGLRTALALARADLGLLRQRYSVVLARTAAELRGISCLPLDTAPAPRKSLIRSRSFGRPVTDLSELREAVAAHAVRAAEKLRAEGLVAGALSVFVVAGRHGRGPSYSGSAGFALSHPTQATAPLLRRALAALDRAHRTADASGRPYRYEKCGVELQELRPAGAAQAHLFEAEPASDGGLHDAVDGLNRRFGRGAVRWARQGVHHETLDTEGGAAWGMRRAHLSPAYTTSWAGLPRVRLDSPTR